MYLCSATSPVVASEDGHQYSYLRKPRGLKSTTAAVSTPSKGENGALFPSVFLKCLAYRVESAVLMCASNCKGSVRMCPARILQTTGFVVFFSGKMFYSFVHSFTKMICESPQRLYANSVSILFVYTGTMDMFNSTSDKTVPYEDMKRDLSMNVRCHWP